MNTRTGKSVYMTIGILSLLCTGCIFLLYLFEGNIGGKLLYQVITTGVFCVFLIYTIIMNAGSVMQQPFSLYIISGFYLIVCLAVCFPNRYVEQFSLLYLIAIPVSVFFGFRYAAVSLVSVYIIMLFAGNYEANELQHVMYAVVASAAAAGRKKQGTDIVTALIALLLQGILLFVSQMFNLWDYQFLITECVIILLNSAMIPLVYRLSNLKERSTDAGTVVIPSDNKIFEIENKNYVSRPEVLATPNITGPFDLSYLVQADCEVALYMKDIAPRAFERAEEIAEFARGMAYKFGANSDLVYAAARYHDIERLYKAVSDVSQVIPEYLYMIIKRQNEKQAPASLEEMLVLLSNHVLAIYHYIERNNSVISTDKVIENIFNLQLKKGYIMTAGISMSLYHRMKQEFTNEFLKYLERQKL